MLVEYQAEQRDGIGVQLFKSSALDRCHEASPVPRVGLSGTGSFIYIKRSGRFHLCRGREPFRNMPLLDT